MNIQNTTHKQSSDYNIEKKSIVNATNELLKWYHGCTDHFTSKAKEIIKSSENPDIIENIIADFLNDEAIGICRELDFEIFGNTGHFHELHQDLDDDNDLDGEEDFEDDEYLDDDESDNYDDDDYAELLKTAESVIDQLREELEVANNMADLYKATLDGCIESDAALLVKYNTLAKENRELKNRLNKLLYGNQES